MKKITTSVLTLDTFIFCSTFFSYFLVFFNGNDVDIKTRVIVGAFGVPLALLFILADLAKNQRIKWLVFIFTALLFIVIPLTRAMYLRQMTGGFSFVHDNPLQIEAAVSFLGKGANPYGQDYAKTLLGAWRYLPWVYDFKGTMPPLSFFRNPALQHAVTLPFGFLAPFPFQLLFLRFFGWYDVRTFYLGAFFVFLYFAYKLLPKEHRLSGLIALTFNPLSTPYLLGGRNDILVLSLIAGTLYFTSIRKYAIAGVLLGFAAASKQSAWIFIPLFILYFFYTTPRKKIASVLAKLIIPCAMIAAVCIIPFFVWNSRAFIDDTMRYVSGALPTSYPIRGFGFSMLLVAFGVIPNVLGSYPGSALQAFAFILSFTVSLFVIKRVHTIQMLLLSYGMCLMLILYFGRFFVDNYLGFIVQVFILAYFISPTYNRAS